MKYSIKQVRLSAPLCGKVSDTPWERARVAEIDTYPWDTGRNREPATVRVLYDTRAVYLQFHVEDNQIAATTTTLNGPVYEDSAVEFFASPTDAGNHYFNFEVNCVGTIHLGWGPHRHDRTHVSSASADRIRVETSETGPTRDPSPDDEGWWLAAALPFETLTELAGTKVAPESATVWRGNFQRLGSGREFAVWAPIDAPEPDFHRPDAFVPFQFEDEE